MRVSPPVKFATKQYSASDRCAHVALFAGPDGVGLCSRRVRWLELDLRLRQQSALEQLRVDGAIELLHRHDDA
jgi:hypothetical protein